MLHSRYPAALYCQQARGIQYGLRGDDLYLAAPTASGKSLVFVALAAHTLLTAPDTQVLALYPAKALIQDQLSKWAELLIPFGLELGYIDRAVLMTPDVAHAWLMSHLRDPDVQAFLSRVALLILDEAHVYDGVFGTNMAYFLRRLRAVTALHGIVSSTATMGAPQEFIERLTGRRPVTLSPADGAGTPRQTVALGRLRSGSRLHVLGRLLAALAARTGARFPAFCASRKAVVQLAAVTLRPSTPLVAPFPRLGWPPAPQRRPHRPRPAAHLPGGRRPGLPPAAHRSRPSAPRAPVRLGRLTPSAAAPTASRRVGPRPPGRLASHCAPTVAGAGSARHLQPAPQAHLTTWNSEDMPMHLHTFEYIARHAITNWSRAGGDQGAN